MPKRLLPLVALLALALLAFWSFTRPPASATTRLDLGNAIADISGFARALAPREFTLPADHGPHPEFQTEWWYYTGNVQTAEGEHYGYQFTLFRRALAPTAPSRASDFAANQIYFAHLAVTDVAGGQHVSSERFSRGAAGLAGASGQPFSVWLEDWRAEALNADGSVARVTARDGEIALDLTLTATKPLVLQGDRGLSQKSPAPGNASYYLSYTRLATTGTITRRGATVAVSGDSWFDHEWSTSALGDGVVGWDWYSLQLSDGREIMFYALRRADGAYETTTSGTLIERDGAPRHLSANAVGLTILAQWQSPHTGATYPAQWQFTIPSEKIDLIIEPWLADQEMQVSFGYWEGAVTLSGASGGQAVTGHGYIELTGYTISMADVF